MKMNTQGVYWAVRLRPMKKGECRGGGEGKEGEIGNQEQLVTWQSQERHQLAT